MRNLESSLAACKENHVLTTPNVENNAFLIRCQPYDFSSVVGAPSNISDKSSSSGSGGSSYMGAVYQAAATGGVHRKTRQQAIGGLLLTGSDVACSNCYG